MSNTLEVKHIENELNSAISGPHDASVHFFAELNHLASKRTTGVEKSSLPGNASEFRINSKSGATLEIDFDKLGNIYDGHWQYGEQSSKGETPNSMKAPNFMEHLDSKN
jgi:hypothetical protein